MQAWPVGIALAVAALYGMFLLGCGGPARARAVYPTGHAYGDGPRAADRHYGCAIFWPLLRKACVVLFVALRSRPPLSLALLRTAALAYLNRLTLMQNSLGWYHAIRFPRDGVRFKRSYAGAAGCTVSRAALMTGRYPWRFGVQFTPTLGAFAAVVGGLGSSDPNVPPSIIDP